MLRRLIRFTDTVQKYKWIRDWCNFLETSFHNKSEKNSEELVVERGEKVERIEGSKDFDERFIDKATGEVDKEKVMK